VKIFTNGDCVLHQEFMLSTSHCPIDIEWFPFDDQHCELIYESKTHESNELSFTEMSPAVEQNNTAMNGEWQLLGTDYDYDLWTVTSSTQQQQQQQQQQ